MPDKPDYYSVDASALIEAKDIYPMEIFESFWSFLSSLCLEGRLCIADKVKSECKDEVLVSWIKIHKCSVVPFDSEFEPYFRAIMVEMPVKGLNLVEPGSTKNEGDPHVIATALMKEQRGLDNLSVHQGYTCYVLTYENLIAANSKLIKIPNVCRAYNLTYIKWPEMLRIEEWHT